MKATTKKGKGKGRGHKISKVKRNNQIKTKMMKQGKMKGKGNTRISSITRKAEKKNPPRPEPVEEEASEDDMLDMVDADDVEFLQDAAASKSYSLLKRIRFNTPKEEGPRKKKNRASAAEDEEAEQMEEEYEEMMHSSQGENKPQRELLPIKTKDGIVRRTTTEMVKKLKPEKAVELIENGGIDEDEEEEEEELEITEEVEDSKLDLSRPVSVAQMLALRQEQLSKYRLRIGCLASGLLEDPNKVTNLKHLLSFLKDKQPIEVAVTVPRLAAISLLEVFKDLLPEYQIKNVDDPTVKLRKDTFKLRAEENNLLAGYKHFLSHMEKLLKPILRRRGQKNQSTPQAVKLSIVALQCLSEMIVARPYFNFSANIVRLLIPFLDHRMPEARDVVAKAIAEVLKNDKKGEISFEIVRRINALVKSKNHAVKPQCLSVLMALRVKDINLDKEKELELKHKKLYKKERNLKTSKRDRKRTKRWEELNKELMETKAEENKQTKQKYFTEVLKLVFTVYFRVLKSAPTSTLLTATLEGLAKFAHCINVEFYNDLVKVLERLLKDEDQFLSNRHQLLCIQTVFAILSGHGEFLTIDPTSFYALLYRIMLRLYTGRNQNDLKVALQIMTDAVLKKRKSLSQQRMFAFTKRICTIATQQQHNGALGCLQLVKCILEFTSSLDVLLEPDTSVGQGVFMPLVDDPEYSNAGNTALYELIVLREHYHPLVRDYARHILRRPNIAQETGQIVSSVLSKPIEKLSAVELFDMYNPEDVQFNPATPSPHLYKPKQRVFFAPSNIKHMKMRDAVESILEEKDNFSKCDFAKCFK